MPVAGCSGWDGFGCLFFGDCESGSGALLGAQDTSGGSWVGVCSSRTGFEGYLEVSVVWLAWVSDPGCGVARHHD